MNQHEIFFNGAILGVAFGTYLTASVFLIRNVLRNRKPQRPPSPYIKELFERSDRAIKELKRKE